MCKDVHDIKERQRKDTRTLKQISSQLELQTPKSPTLEGEPETFEQQLARYEQESDAYFFGQSQSAPTQPLPAHAQTQLGVPSQSQTDTVSTHPTAQHSSVAEETTSDWWRALLVMAMSTPLVSTTLEVRASIVVQVTQDRVVLTQLEPHVQMMRMMEMVLIVIKMMMSGLCD